MDSPQGNVGALQSIRSAWHTYTIDFFLTLCHGKESFSLVSRHDCTSMIFFPVIYRPVRILVSSFIFCRYYADAAYVTCRSLKTGTLLEVIVDVWHLSGEKIQCQHTHADLWLRIQAGLPCVNKSVAIALKAPVFYCWSLVLKDVLIYGWTLRKPQSIWIAHSLLVFYRILN